jgi:two-component system phosphate regulon sensor histidine kinase PhoR
MADGLLVVDADGCVQVYTLPAEEMLGLPPGSLAVGVPLSELTALPGLLAAVQERLQPGGAARGPVLEIGPLRTVEAEVTRLAPLGAGGAPSVLILLRDLRDAERLHGMRRDFIASVSHEMRTPLAAIRGASQTLLDGALGDGSRARRFVSVIDDHAARLGVLLDDLGQLADLEQGGVAMHRQPLAVSNAVAGALRASRAIALGAGVGLHSAVAEDTPPLDGDRDLLDLVLLRLIDNAVRGTPRGGTVTVSAGATAPPGGAAGAWVRLAVVDAAGDAHGDEAAAVVARARHPGGVGLAVVKHIVRAHGGVMEIAGGAEHGTSVTLVWPSADAAEMQGGER